MCYQPLDDERNSEVNSGFGDWSTRTYLNELS